MNKKTSKTRIIPAPAPVTIQSRNNADFGVEYEPMTPRELENQYRAFFGNGTEKYAIYAPAWSNKLGRTPQLGIVYADNEFLAEKLAYDRGMLPSHNLKPKIKHLGSVRRPLNADAVDENQTTA